MNLLHTHRYLTSLAVCIIALALFLGLTNPDQVSIGLLIVPIILLFFIAFCAAQVLLQVVHLFASRPRKRRVVALTAASFVTVIMILQSTGGVSGADFLLLALIIGVFGIYIDKF
jgi:low temperature requirement protein LtrA